MLPIDLREFLKKQPNAESWVFTPEQMQCLQPELARGTRRNKAMKWKVSHPKASPRGSCSLFYSLGLACTFSGVEKYISYKEFHRQRGAQRNLKGGLGARGWEGGERATGETQACKRSRCE